MILALLSFGGYTTIVSLSEEAREPKQNVGKAIIFTALLAGFVFVISSYALTIGWGYNNMAAFAALPLPGFTVIQAKVGLVAALILAVIVLSANLNAVNGQMVNVSRLVYRMSRDRIFPTYLGKAHPKYQTPYTALLFLTVVSTIVMIAAYFLITPMIDAVFLLATFATVGTIMVHTMTNVSLIPYSIRRHEFRPVVHLLLPLVGSGLILYALYASLYPFVYPYYLAPIGIAIWSVIIIVYVLFHVRKRSDAGEIGKFTL